MNYAVVMPVFNEVMHFSRALARLRASPPVTNPATGEVLGRIIVIVDDGSHDGTGELVAALRAGNHADLRIVAHQHNRGKGAAVRSGIAAALESVGSDPLQQAADFIVIHDSDLEYDPGEHQQIMLPILDGRADVVIGSRFLGGGAHRVLYFWHSVANRFITFLSNICTNLNLTDIECCSKAFSREVASRLVLKEDRFGIEPELVARFAALRIPDERPSSELPTAAAGGAFRPPSGPMLMRALRIYEVPVSYAGRTYAEGKKITWQDGFAAIRCIVLYNLFS